MPVVTLPPLAVDPEFCVVSRWNLSLPAKTRWRIFGLLATVSLTLAIAFAVAGAGVGLAYPVLALGGLAGAFHYLQRRARAWERFTVSGGRVLRQRCEGSTPGRGDG